MIVLRVLFLLSISYNTQISKDEDLYISKEILKSVDLAGQSSVELDFLSFLFSLCLHISDSHTFLHFGQF